MMKTRGSKHRQTDKVLKPTVSPRIGYVLKRWPRLSETFILQEILLLEDQGVNLVLFPTMDPRETLRNPRVNDVRAPVFYTYRPFWHTLGSTLVDHGYLFLTSPRRYRAAWRYFVLNRRSRGSVKHFVQGATLARDVQRQGIEHLHAHFTHSPTSLARNASLFSGVPFSFTAHAKDLYTTDPNSIAAKARLATFVATCTNYNARYLREILDLTDREKVHTVYHGVDTERFRPALHRTANPQPVIASVGRLVRKKGFQYLIEAAALLWNEGLPFLLDIYGDGPLLDSLQEQISSAGLQSVVRIQGSCTQDELISIYQQTDIFALAPYVTDDGDRDGIPNVILEAMATGLPVVSTEISGIPEVIHHERNGLLVAPGNSVALADALRTLITSEPLARRLGQAGRVTVCNNFDARNNINALLALFRVSGETHADCIRTC